MSRLDHLPKFIIDSVDKPLLWRWQAKPLLKLWALQGKPTFWDNLASISWMPLGFISNKVSWLRVTKCSCRSEAVLEVKAALASRLPLTTTLIVLLLQSISLGLIAHSSLSLSPLSKRRLTIHLSRWLSAALKSMSSCSSVSNTW